MFRSKPRRQTCLSKEIWPASASQRDRANANRRRTQQAGGSASRHSGILGHCPEARTIASGSRRKGGQASTSSLTEPCQAESLSSANAFSEASRGNYSRILWQRTKSCSNFQSPVFLLRKEIWKEREGATDSRNARRLAPQEGKSRQEMILSQLSQ